MRRRLIHVLMAVAATTLLAVVPGRPVAAASAFHISFTGLADVTPPVQLVGGSGTYTFTTSSSANGLPGACVGGGYYGGVGGVLCTMTAAGSWANIVCGTGYTGGGLLGESDTATVTFTSPLPYSFSFNYGIIFVAGHGTIHGTGTTKVSGSVDITPVQGDCVTGVTEFQATGYVDVS